MSLGTPTKARLQEADRSWLGSKLWPLVHQGRFAYLGFGGDEANWLFGAGCGKRIRSVRLCWESGTPNHCRRRA